MIAYSEIPSFLVPYISCRNLERLKYVDMNCGVTRTSLPFFQTLKPYSRYVHSIGAALIAWHFTNDQRITLAALFHDVATPVFSHVIDFLYGDYLSQETTEHETEQMIASDEICMQLLNKDQISLDEVKDYHIYPIADNASPKLCADRLEYTCSNAVNYGFASSNEIEELYCDLYTGKNEFDEDEIMFSSLEKAEKFAFIALQCGRIYSSKEDRYAMDMLSDLLKKALRNHIVEETDFYTLSEEAVIEKLENSSLESEWHAYQKLCAVESSLAKKDGYRKICVKKRMIDPYVMHQGRVSELSQRFSEELSSFQNENQNIWLIGKY